MVNVHSGLRLVIATLMIGLACQVCRADSPDEAVRRILNASGVKQTTLQQAESMMAHFARLVAQSDKALSESESRRIIELVMSAFDKRFPEFIELIIPVYRKHFTDAELSELAALSESPLGRKAGRLMPAITREAAVIGSKWGRQVGEDAARAALEAAREPSLLGQLGDWHAWSAGARPKH